MSSRRQRRPQLRSVDCSETQSVERVTCTHGELLSCSPLSKTAILVSFRQQPVSSWSAAERTWTLVGAKGQSYWEGLKRSELPSVPFEISSDGSLDTGELTVRLLPGSELGLAWSRSSPNAHVFASDLKAGAYTYVDGGEGFHYMQRRPDECVYGCGESTGSVNKASPARRYRLAATDACGYDAQFSDPCYKHTPFFIVYSPSEKLAYGMIYTQLCGGVLDFGAEISAFRGEFRYYTSANGCVDYVLVVSRAGAAEPVADVVSQVITLLGPPALPPRWALGYLGSTMTYTDAPNAQERLREFGELCEMHSVPCSGFHLSSGYTLDRKGVRNVFTWDRQRIPDPAAMFDDFHGRGMSVLPNVKPWLLKDSHPEYSKIAVEGGLLRQPDAPPPAAALGHFWQGGPNTFADGSYLDFSSHVGVKWWKSKLKESLLSLGADGAWNDNNEFEVFDDGHVTCALTMRDKDDGGNGNDKLSNTPVAVVGRALQPLLMARASYEACQEFRPSLRPFVVSRSGSLGSHRYCAQTWSGDNMSTWHALKWCIPMSLSLGLSGWIGNGMDVGGFAGSKPDPELLLRWCQLGVLMPRFSIHSCSWKDSKADDVYSLEDQSTNSPWLYPTMLDPIRDVIQWRYRMMPLLASLHLEAVLFSRLPVVRPLALHWATDDDDRSRNESFEFTLGRDILVAAVMEAGATERRCYLPGGAGEWWCEMHTGHWHRGGTTVTVKAPLHRRAPTTRSGSHSFVHTSHFDDGLQCCGAPVFLRGGAGMVLSGEKFERTRHIGKDDRVVILAAPPCGTGTVRCAWYEDDGETQNYLRGGWSRVVVEASFSESNVFVSSTRAEKPPKGGFDLPYETLSLCLPRGDRRQISVTGSRAAYSSLSVDGSRSKEYVIARLDTTVGHLDDVLV